MNIERYYPVVRFLDIKLHTMFLQTQSLKERGFAN